MKSINRKLLGLCLAIASFFAMSASLGAQSTPIKLGFIPLTDASPIIMAQELGLFKKYGVEVVVSKEASWASVRDKILLGELDGAHCLFGMPLSVYSGIGGTKDKEMKIAMVISSNGQATTLSNEDFGGKVGYSDLKGLKSVLDSRKGSSKESIFAMTFPGGTHDMWLRYALAAAGVSFKDVKIITIPPPQMVANMKVNNMDGYNVGEPWGGVAVKDNIGFTFMATQDLWKDHPEKALVVNSDFAAKRKDDLKKVMKAVLEACAWLDDLKNRDDAAKIIGKSAYVNAPSEVIDARLAGNYALGSNLGSKQFTDNNMKFYDGGKVNFPRKGYAIWFLEQYYRFGLVKEVPDFKKIVDTLILQDLYKEVAKEMKIAIPDDDMKPFTIKLDNVTFDPKNPTASYKPVQ